MTTDLNIMTSKFSDYIAYVDESGDHNLQNIDQNYPLFVLAFCVFHKRHYCEDVVSAIEQFKFNHFGHDLVVLHEHEIRKEKGDFNIFKSKQQRHDFLDELSAIIDDSNFVIISCVIEKERLKGTHAANQNPYHIALAFCLESLSDFISEKEQQQLTTHVIVEQRGKKEDNELELEFRRICSGANKFKQSLPFDVRFANKQANSSGLQLADLVARPIGMHVLRPDQNNRTFDVLKHKFYCPCNTKTGRENTGRGYEEWGLKRFPRQG